jgi:hypothetical protein
MRPSIALLCSVLALALPASALAVPADFNVHRSPNPDWRSDPVVLAHDATPPDAPRISIRHGSDALVVALIAAAALAVGAGAGFAAARRRRPRLTRVTTVATRPKELA